MKKLLLILLSLFAFSLTGCVDDNQNDSDLKKKDHSQELIECIMNSYPDGFQLENGWYKISLSKKINLEYYEYYEVNDIYAYINFDKSSFDGVITKMTSSKYTYKIIDSDYILFETSQVYLNDGYYISKTTQDGSKEIKFDKSIKSIKLSINLNERIFDLNRLNEEYNKNNIVISLDQRKMHLYEFQGESVNVNYYKFDENYNFDIFSKQHINNTNSTSGFSEIINIMICNSEELDIIIPQDYIEVSLGQVELNIE